MPVRSRMLAAGTTVTVGNTQWLYTVPAGRTAIVRYYSFVNRSGATREVGINVRRSGVVVNVERRTGLADQARIADTDSNLVLNPGDAIGVFLGSEVTSPTIHYIVAGSLLDGEPA